MKVIGSFDLPPALGKQVNESAIWQRYEPELLEYADAYPLVLHLVNVWQHLFSDILDTLERVQISLQDSNSELAGTVHGLHTIFRFMSSDLKEMVNFGTWSLGCDPWVLNCIEELRKVRPEWFADETADDDNEQDEPAVTVNEALLPEDIPPLA